MSRETLSLEAPKFLKEKAIKVLALTTMACGESDLGLGMISLFGGAIAGICWSEALPDGLNNRLGGAGAGFILGAILYSELGGGVIAGEVFLTAMYFFTKGGEGLRNFSDRLDQWIQRRKGTDADGEGEERKD